MLVDAECGISFSEMHMFIFLILVKWAATQSGTSQYHGDKKFIKKKKSTLLYAVQSPSGQGVPKITGTQPPALGAAISGTPQPSSTKVEPPIMEHVLSLNTFQYFPHSLINFQYLPHSLIKLSDFCVIGCTNWKVTNVLWALEIRKATPEEDWVIVCFNFFLTAFDLSIVPALYLPHF
jgi:hypothetical protein